MTWKVVICALPTLTYLSKEFDIAWCNTYLLIWLKILQSCYEKMSHWPKKSGRRWKTTYFLWPKIVNYGKMKVFLFLLFFSHLQELCLNGQGNTFQEYQWQLARKSQWCYTKKEYKVTDFQRQCYKSILILEVNFLTLWILAIIPRQAIFAMLKTWILTFLNNLWTMPTKSWTLQYQFSQSWAKILFFCI